MKVWDFRGSPVMPQPRHQREDLKVAEGREAFAALLFDYFDRKKWWNGKKLPWRRLADDMDMSPQVLIDAVSNGAAPRHATIRALAEATDISIETWYEALATPDQETTEEGRIISQTLKSLPPDKRRIALQEWLVITERLAQPDTDHEMHPTRPGDLPSAI